MHPEIFSLHIFSENQRDRETKKQQANLIFRYAVIIHYPNLTPANGFIHHRYMYEYHRIAVFTKFYITAPHLYINMGLGDNRAL